MNNELVHNIKNDFFVDSKTIADNLEVTHKDLLRTIERIVERQKNNVPTSPLKFPPIFIEGSFINKMNRSFKMYEMNESAFMKLAMQLSGYEKAEVVQDAIIESFQLMKRALLNHENASWINARKESKEIRKIETDTIKDFVNYATKQGSKNAKFYYSNVTKMTNKALEILLQVKDGKPMRDLASVQELGYIRTVENLAQEAIKYGMDNNLPYKFIYSDAKEKVSNLVDVLDVKNKLKTK